jgi:mannose-6-phosphate isomerase-like protein (cupin superfamily)
MDPAYFVIASAIRSCVCSACFVRSSKHGWMSGVPGWVADVRAVPVDCSPAFPDHLSIVEEIHPLDTPLHVHHDHDELFYVLEGEHVFSVGGTEFEAGPGDLIFGPRGVPHAQRRVIPRTGRILEMFSPAGFEGFFSDLAEMDRNGQIAVEDFHRIAAKFGVTWMV